MATNELISPLGEGSLDLEQIRTDLKQYLIDNNVIKDVDFEGSNISQLIDVISFSILNINSTNALLVNESILSKSTFRQNIIEIAKQLSYNITRRISAKINTTISFDGFGGAVTSVSIPQYTKWQVGDYTFLNTSAIVLTTATPSVTIDLVEGTFIDSIIDTELLVTVIEDTKEFKINYKNIENDRVQVYVKKNGEAVFSTPWTKVDSLLKLEDNKNFYFEDFDSDTGWVTIQTSFAGNGYIFGVDDQIKFDFITTNGVEANGLVDVQQIATITDNTSTEVQLTLSVNSASRGGQGEESDESIKENAPKFFNTGGRAVNDLDYEAFLEQSSNIEKSAAWGGEVILPNPNLGTIYFSALPQDTAVDYFTNIEIADMLTLLQDVRIISTQRQYWHPSYVFVDIDIKLLGDISDSATKQTQIQDLLTTEFDTTYNQFKTFVYTTKLIALIESVFESDFNASVTVNIKPKIKLLDRMFDNEYKDANNDIVVYVPNSDKNFYLVKGTDQIPIPEDNADLVSFLNNGWSKQFVADEALDIIFGGTIDDQPVTTDDNSGAYYSYNGTNNAKKILLNGVTLLGYFDYQESIIYFDSAEMQSRMTTNTEEFLEMTYSPQFNARFSFNNFAKLGTITYV